MALASFTKIDSCFNSAEIRSISQDNGGIAGVIFHSEISNSYNNGNIKVTKVNRSVWSSGGIVGEVFRESKITNVWNSGNVSALQASAGGIASAIFSSEISNSYNKGNVKVTYKNMNAWSTGGIVGDGLRTGILVSVLTCEIIDTILINHLDGIGLHVDIEGEGLLRQFLHGIENGTVMYGKVALSVHIIEHYGGFHHVLAIGGCDGKLVAIHFEKETVEDSQTVLVVKDPGKGCKSAAQGRTG